MQSSLPSVISRACLLCCGLLLGAATLRAGTGFVDSFPGSSLSATNWGASGGTATVSSTAVANPGLQLISGAGAYSKRWIRSAAANYGYVGTTETFQTTVSSFSNATALTCASIYILGNSANTSITDSTPDYDSPNVLEVRLQAQSSTAATLSFRAKTGAANAAGIDPGALTSIGGLPLSGTFGISFSNPGASSPTTVTIFYTNGTISKYQSYLLPATYNASFTTTSESLYLQSATGSNGVTNTTKIAQFNANGFQDPFTGGALSAVNWSGMGGSGVTTVNGGLTLTTAAAATAQQWIEAAGSNFPFVNATQTYEATLTSLSSTTGSSLSICLIGGTATAAELASATPSVSAPDVLELRFSSNGDGTGTLALYGKTGAAGSNTALLLVVQSHLELDPTAGFPGKMGLVTNNTGAGASTTLTVYYVSTDQTEPWYLNYTLANTAAAPYTTNFAGSNHLYLAASAPATATATKAVVSEFMASGAPVLPASVTIANTTAYQQITDLGGNYAKGRYTGIDYVDDVNGTDNLASLQPKTARIGIPLEAWVANDVGAVSSTNIGTLLAPGGYFDTEVKGNADLADSFSLISALKAGGVTNFVFSVWGVPSYMETAIPNTTQFDLVETTAGQQEVLAGIATFLLYAQNYYSLDLSKVSICFNEADSGGLLLTPAEVAGIMDTSKTYFPALGITNTAIWVAGDTGLVNEAPLVINGVSRPTGAADKTTYSGFYTDQVMQNLASLGDLGLVKSIAYHSWDEYADPQALAQVRNMGLAYNRPIVCNEVGYTQTLWFAGSVADPANYNTYVGPSWNNARRLADIYLKVLKYSGATTCELWEYMQDYSILNNTTGSPYPAFYIVDQLHKTFPAGSYILGNTNTGLIESLAGGASGSACSVQIIQLDSRGEAVALTGLLPGQTYGITQSSPTQNEASLGTQTADSTGALMLTIPPAPIEISATGTTNTYFQDSGSVITLALQPTITTASQLAIGTTGTAYSQTFAAADGTLPCTWSLGTGTLPAGLTLSAAGVLSGTPTAAGTYNFTLTATDSAGLTSTQTFSLTIGAPGVLQHFTFDYVPAAAYAATPFAVQITARDSAGSLVATYNGTAALTVPGSTGAPATVPLTNGVFLGYINVATTGTMSLTAAASNATGTSSSLVVGTGVSTAGDGIPDAWKTANGFSVSANVASLDSDGDGMSNLQEFLAGTDPRSPSSKLAILSFTVPVAGQVTVTWPGVAGKLYEVSTSTDLINWTAVAPLALATSSGTQTTTVNSGSATNFFVRVAIAPYQ